MSCEYYVLAFVSGTPATVSQLFLSTVRCPNPELHFLSLHPSEAEAEVCRQIVLALLRKKRSRLLEHFAKRTQVDIHTVDSVQGREKDIVVLLTTTGR
ncbi:hypothetical protein COOONC_24389, partial [Cooperia oncophora]